MEVWSPGVLRFQSHHSCALDPPRRVFGARLVSEQSERRDHRDEPGIHEVRDYCINVLVSGRSLLVEQVALSTDNAATQRGLDKLLFSEPFAHALAGFAPGPFATRTVSQRPGTAFAITREA